MKWNEYTFTVTDLATGDVIAPKWKVCSEGESPIHLARTIYDERRSRLLKIQASNRDWIWEYETRLFPWPDDVPPRPIGVHWRR